jgi:peptidoglycan/LPS O-acetylase OafA/YrhL
MGDKHILQLDGLRFIAILMVMIAHWLQWQWGNEFLLSLPFVNGVTLFFVLSGFLITRILFSNKGLVSTQNEKKFILKNFYIRRFLRIFPLYYLLIFCLYIFNYENTREIFPWLISYTSNIYQTIYSIDLGDFNHFWSLAVEEQFYLFWPLIILFTKPSKYLTVILTTLTLALVVKLLLYKYTNNWMALDYFTISCMFSLGLGALLAFFTLYKSSLIKTISSSSLLYAICGIYILMLILQYKFSLKLYKSIFEEILFAVASMLIILRASLQKFKGLIKIILENRFVVYCGKISYGMYVLHLFIPNLIYWLVPDVIPFNKEYSFAKYALFLVYFISTFLIAHFSWKFFEAPINKLKIKFPYKN